MEVGPRVKLFSVMLLVYEVLVFRQQAYAFRQYS